MLSIYQEHYNKLTKIVHIQSNSKQQNISEREKQFQNRCAPPISGLSVLPPSALEPSRSKTASR